MKTTAFKILEKIRNSQNHIDFLLRPLATAKGLDYSLQEVLEGYKKYIKERREDERRSEFPKGAQFVEPPIRMRIKMVHEMPLPSLLTKRKEISKEEPEFKPIRMKDLLKGKENFVLIADSGLGKTTLLKELQYKIVTGDLPAEELPIYFHFRDLIGVFSTEALLERICNLFPKKVEGVEQTVNTLFHQKSLLFLLDGLDQVEDRSNLPKLLDRKGPLSPHRVILAGRPYIYSSLQSQLPHYQYLTLDTFSTELSKKYLRENIYESFRSLLQEPSLRDPMLLSILMELGQEAAQGVNRTQIYQKMVDKLLGREASLQALKSHLISKEVFSTVFSKLSYILLDKDCTGRFPWTIVDSLLPELNITWGDFVRLTHLGLISEVMEGSPLPGRDLVFRHQSFQDYLASQELKERLFTSGRVNKAVLIDHLEFNRWDEVFFFLIGSLNERDAREIISFVSRYDLFLAGKCIAHYKGDKDKDFGEIIDKLFSKLHLSDAKEVLAKIGSEDITTRLIGLFKDKDVRWEAAEALGMIGSERAIEHLIPLLKDKDVRGMAASALGMIGSEMAVEHLIPLLKDEDMFVCAAAAGALGMIGSEMAVEHLIPLLKDEDKSVRAAAALALSIKGTEKAVEDLLPLLKDEGKSVRVEAAKALGRIGSEKAVEHLIPLLKDKDESVRSAAVLALGVIGSEKAVERLIPLLKDEDILVCGEAVLTLGMIGTERAVEHLIPLLKDKSVRGVAALALGAIGTERAVEDLLPLLKDEDESVRSAAVLALGVIGSEKAVEHLIPLLKNEDISVRGIAAYALGNVSKKLKDDELIGLVERLHKEGRNEAMEKIKKVRQRRFLRVLYPESLR